MFMFYENYYLLAEAIVMQAIWDYKRCKSHQDRISIEKFFRSGWFRALCDIDGEQIIRKLKMELKTGKK